MQCASLDGRNCLWGTCPPATQATRPWHPQPRPAHLIPLICGPDHAAKHGGNGYQSEGHWCREACQRLGCEHVPGAVPPPPRPPAGQVVLLGAPPVPPVVPRLRDRAVVPLPTALSRRDFCRALGVALLGGGACGPGAAEAGTDLAVGLDLAAAPPDGARPPDATLPPGDASPALDQATPEGDAGAADGDLAAPDLAPDPEAERGACPRFFFPTLLLPAAFAVDTATFFLQPSVFVCRDGRGLFAVSAICTHQGFTIDAENGGADGFRCRWHGSRFSLGGQVTQGPAVAPLDHLPLCLDGRGRVGVDLLQTVGAGVRYPY